ncbi:hypothetical protein M8C13_08975 [Crossiella sp. SN42]|uniref:hypothetical protein n=1 Tax=Crossiella sp. SN42 TaxID=2944808 RepID=UPI00207C817D|nr:hypothetical protein [Crossiella sp. SN42]MCO1575889.1 hypothetical protein [Crossiella sp. SN42]
MGHPATLLAARRRQDDQDPGHVDAEAQTELIELFTRLAHAGCRPLQTNPYLIHEPPNHGDILQDSEVSAAIAGAPSAIELVELPVSYSDYGGSDLDVANQRSLIETFGEGTFVRLVDGHGSAGLALPYQRPLPDDDDHDLLRQLVEQIETLRESPLLNDETHSAYVTELADAAWEQWLRYDVASDLRDRAPDDQAEAHLDSCSEETVREAYYAFENEWVCQTATSVTNLRHAEAITHIAETVLGWPSR